MMLWLRRRRKGEIDYIRECDMRVWLTARLRSILEASGRKRGKVERSKSLKGMYMI